MTILVTALVVWAASGVVTAAILARHGHNFWFFAAMGLGFGPFVVLVWLEGARGQRSKSVVVRSSDATNERGWIDVLVGLDGSADSVESVGQVLKTLRQAVRRIRLVSALDHEISNSPDSFLSDDRRVEYLNAAAQSLGVVDAEIALISGQPDKALLDHAAKNKFDLLVVAHRGHPVISGIQGSTVARLARSAEIPVLIGPPA